MIKNAEAVLRGSGLAELADRKYARVTHPRYIDYDDRTKEVMAMFCRLCGVRIAGWLDEDVVEQRTDRTDPSHIVTKLIVNRRFARFPDAKQVRFLLSNDALYEPCVCRGCAKNVDLDVGRELYVSDLVEMVAEAMVHGRWSEAALSTIRDLMKLDVVRGIPSEG